MPADQHLPRGTAADLPAIDAFQRAVDDRIDQGFLRVRLRHSQIEIFGHRRAHAAAFDGDEGCVLRTTLALGVAVVALTDCNLGRRDVQSCQNLGASEAHPAVGADAVGAQPLGQAEAGRKEPVGQGIIGQHDRLAGRADLDLVLGQQLGDLVRHEPHVPVGFLDELTGLGAIQDIEQPRVLSHTRDSFRCFIRPWQTATASTASSPKPSSPAACAHSRVIGAPPAMSTYRFRSSRLSRRLTRSLM